MEKNIIEIKNSIENAAASSSKEIRGTISSLLDTPPNTSAAVEAAAKSAEKAAVAAVTTTTTADTIGKILTDLKKDLTDSHAALAEDLPQLKSSHATLAEDLTQLISSLRKEFLNSHLTLACEVKAHIEEIAETFSTTQPSQSKSDFDNCTNLADELNSIEQSKPHWRMIGNKKIWKHDWTEYDARQHSRRLQEKNEEKARHRRRQRKRRYQQIFNNNNNNNNNNNYNGSSNNHSSNYSNEPSDLLLPPDRDLLAMAKTQFSGPPMSIDHPIAGLSVTAAKSSFINFEKAETINPYRSNETLQSSSINTDFQLQQSIQQHTSDTHVNDTSPASTRHTDGQFELDPMRPPIVRLTEQSTNGDGRFLKARLRDPKIMKIVRLYLAYMKDQPATVCVEGMTPTSIRMLLASEGLPTAPDHLQRIFAEVHQEYGMNADEAAADLQSYQRFLSSERTHRLQQLRESTNKFHSHSLNQNFRK